MFEQVCNETIRTEIENGLEMPEDNKNRMKLVSKSWRIRPMSYKQFSNLVSKQNAFYKTLEKINGAQDPLRKTLVIIDEAHKLYSGDLSTIEQPDMDAFHRAVMTSYMTSGKNSVKLLFMTATPITKDPMELIKLLNLCKSPEAQIPTNFEVFSAAYLDEDGKFSEKGQNDYLNAISGHVSYLNREKDARQFAQPEINHVAVPIVSNIEEVNKFDKKTVRQELLREANELNEKIAENGAILKGEIGKLNAKKLAFLKEKCEDIDIPKVKKECAKIVRDNIKELVNEAKSEMLAIKNKVKELRDKIKQKNEHRNKAMNEIVTNREKNQEGYEKYQSSLYYQLKSKCGKSVKLSNSFREQLHLDPEVAEMDAELARQEERIEAMKQELRASTEVYKNRIERIKKLLKTNLTELERSVVKLSLKDARKTMRVALRGKNKDFKDEVKTITKSIKTTQKAREKKYKSLRKTLKKKIKEDKKELNRKTAEEKKNKSEFKDDKLKQLINGYSSKIDKELREATNRIEEEKEMKALVKEAARFTRKAQKDEERAAKKGTQKAKKSPKK
jgi:hypothetical protein